ncbi:methyltransferase domain-containing protein [Polaromonas sp.]|uniref:class I SAM-dependent methyltransferase n=1 Tax=Polaromonas sp. TaxID=1869339 RepID=UPI0013B9962E|nr:methyltransferase domain-containing protein [Polaromonas sp.]NDP62400.1 methyltransferase domain-containing protein [Polaromonas sp.]
MNQQRVEGQAGHAAAPCVSPAFGQLRDSFQFLRGFVRNPAQVGSVIPSSRQLEQRLVRSARIGDARMVVELGPGTGGTTSAFLRAMASNAQLLAIELDTEFHQRLHASIRDARFSVELGSAERLDEFLSARRLPAPDAIISGIPFSTMPAEVSDRVASSVARVLRPGGRFVAYQVRAHVSSFVSPYLGKPEKKWEVVNVPPVRVFTWVKPET